MGNSIFAKMEQLCVAFCRLLSFLPFYFAIAVQHHGAGGRRQRQMCIRDRYNITYDKLNCNSSLPVHAWHLLYGKSVCVENRIVFRPTRS